MTIPSSSAPAARTWLFNALTAGLTLDQLSPSSSLGVCYDQPGPNEPDDIVAIGKVTNRITVNSFVGGGGAGWLYETYSVEVTVDVFRGGDDTQVAYLRASALADEVNAIVRTDPSLGGTVLVAKPMLVTTDAMWDDAHMGRHATAVIEIECSQRI